MTEQEVAQEHLTFLDRLRESGVTNMYGAAAYVEREFGVSKRDARFILQTWMATFAQRHSGGAS